MRWYRRLLTESVTRSYNSGLDNEEEAETIRVHLQDERRTTSEDSDARNG